jgi:hypothetical protein
VREKRSPCISAPGKRGLSPIPVFPYSRIPVFPYSRIPVFPYSRIPVRSVAGQRERVGVWAIMPEVRERWSVPYLLYLRTGKEVYPPIYF